LFYISLQAKDIAKVAYCNNDAAKTTTRSEVYNEMFYTNKNNSYSVSYELGLSYWKNRDVSQAKTYLSKTVIQNPYDIEKMNTYGRFLLYNTDSIDLIISIIDRVYSLDSLYMDSNILLAVLLQRTENFAGSLEHIAAVRRARYWFAYKMHLVLLEENTHFENLIIVLTDLNYP